MGEGKREKTVFPLRIFMGKQCLKLRFDGIADCLRTPEGGSSKQFLIVKKDGELHARLLLDF